jgi:bifunctional enzyme CysN/CysC
VHWQAVDVDKTARAALSWHRPAIVWFTGISGAGKSTIANLVEKRLHADGIRTYLIDGDNVRHGLSKDLGFTAADRIENIRRVGEVATMMVEAGVVVLVSLISPFAEERAAVRAKVEPGEFVEVYVDTPLDVAAARDVKGLYRKAADGDLPNLSGVDSAYEPPQAPEVHVRTAEVDVEMGAHLVIEHLYRSGVRR